MSDPPRLAPYRLTFEDRPGYLFVRVEGEADSYEISRQFWTEIAKESARRRIKRVFVEECILGQMPTIADVHQGACERQDMGLIGLKIAFYDTFPSHKDQNEFGELVVRNRGVDLRVFEDPDKGIEWLLED